MFCYNNFDCKNNVVLLMSNRFFLLLLNIKIFIESKNALFFDAQ